MNNLKSFLVSNRDNEILPIGKTGIYINPDEFSQFVVDWMVKTPDWKKREQLENFGKALLIGGVSVLFLLIFLQKQVKER